MDGKVAHLHLQYRTPAGGSPPPHLGARLERIIREHLAESWGGALDSIMTDDQTVYVLRDIHVSLTLRLTPDRSEAAAAVGWGRQMAHQTVRHIVREGEDNVRSFGSIADYIAHFIDALLRGRAWQVWYFYPFAHLRFFSLDETVAAALREARASLPQVLAALIPFGTFDLLLQRLNEETIRQLWHQGVETAYAAAHRDSLVALTTHLLDICDALGLWTQGRPSIDKLLDSYLDRSDALLDWRDSSALAHILGDVFRSMVQAGTVRRLTASELIEIQPRLDTALMVFTYLDTQSFKRSILASLSNEEIAQPAPLLLSARGTLLLDDLLTLLRDDPLRLDPSGSLAANSLRLYTALIARFPRWSGDPLASTLIERIVSAWRQITCGSLPALTSAAIARGYLSDALANLPPDTLPEVRRSLQFLVGAGPKATAAISLLGGPTVTHMTREPSIQTDCAGVFLLIRAVRDLRLHTWLESSGDPPTGQVPRLTTLLASVCLYWAGEASVRDGVLDPAVTALAGLEPGFTLEELRLGWAGTNAEDHERFWWALLRRLHSHRLISGSALRLGKVILTSGEVALVAQDADTGLFAAGRLFDQITQQASAAWTQPWEAITGLPLVLDDAPTDELQPLLGGTIPAVLADPHADLMLALTASGLLRVWAHWLRQFNRSSDAYLLNNLIRRSGSLHMNDQRILVALESRPLDLILERAGYLSPMEAIEWLGKRHVRFQLEGR